LCKDKRRNIVADTVDILERWAQHFEEVLNPNNVHPENHIHPSEEFEENVELDIDEMDVELAIKELKTYKAPGPDGLPAEVFKYGADILNKYLYKLISEIWTKEEMPVDWKVGLICPIYKKGDLLECKNYRDITLANVGYKIFYKVLFRKLEPIVRKDVGKYQRGFIAGKSTGDQIFNLRQIMEETLEYLVKTYYLFIY
jgi:hypothetical protein